MPCCWLVSFTGNQWSKDREHRYLCSGSQEDTTTLAEMPELTLCSKKLSFTDDGTSSRKYQTVERLHEKLHERSEFFFDFLGLHSSNVRLKLSEFSVGGESALPERPVNFSHPGPDVAARGGLGSWRFTWTTLLRAEHGTVSDFYPCYTFKSADKMERAQKKDFYAVTSCGFKPDRNLFIIIAGAYGSRMPIDKFHVVHPPPNHNEISRVIVISAEEKIFLPDGRGNPQCNLDEREIIDACKEDCAEILQRILLSGRRSEDHCSRMAGMHSIGEDCLSELDIRKLLDQRKRIFDACNTGGEVTNTRESAQATEDIRQAYNAGNLSYIARTHILTKMVSALKLSCPSKICHTFDYAYNMLEADYVGGPEQTNRVETHFRTAKRGHLLFEEIKTYGFTQFFGDAGGFTGFWLGCSILTLVRFISQHILGRAKRLQRLLAVVYFFGCNIFFIHQLGQSYQNWADPITATKFSFQYRTSVAVPRLTICQQQNSDIRNLTEWAVKILVAGKSIAPDAAAASNDNWPDGWQKIVHVSSMGNALACYSYYNESAETQAGGVPVFEIDWKQQRTTERYPQTHIGPFWNVDEDFLPSPLTRIDEYPDAKQLVRVDLRVSEFVFIKGCNASEAYNHKISCSGLTADIEDVAAARKSGRFSNLQPCQQTKYTFTITNQPVILITDEQAALSLLNEATARTSVQIPSAIVKFYEEEKVQGQEEIMYELGGTIGVLCGASILGVVGFFLSFFV